MPELVGKIRLDNSAALKTIQGTKEALSTQMSASLSKALGAAQAFRALKLGLIEPHAKALAAMKQAWARYQSDLSQKPTISASPKTPFQHHQELQALAEWQKQMAKAGSSWNAYLRAKNAAAGKSVTSEQESQLKASAAAFEAESAAAKRAAAALKAHVDQQKKMADQWRTNPPPVIAATALGRLKQSLGGLDLKDVLSNAGGGGLGGSLIGGLAGGFTGAIVGQIVTMIGYKILAAVRELFEFIRSGVAETLQYGRTLQNLGAQTGISPGAGAVLGRSAEMAQLDPEAVSIWFSRFQANLSTVKNMTPGVVNSLAKLNLNFLDLSQMKPEDQLVALADGFSRVKSQDDKAGIAMALFNRQGANMLRMFNDPGLMKLAVEQAGSLARLTREDADAMGYLSNSIEGLKLKKMQLFVGLLQDSMPALELMASLVNKIDLKSVGEFAATAGKDMLGSAIGTLPGLFDLIGLLFKPKIPRTSEPGTEAGGMPFDMRNVTGHGAGDQWSRLGAFSYTGGQKSGAFATLTYQQQIANNTKTTSTILQQLVDKLSSGAISNVSRNAAYAY